MLLRNLRLHTGLLWRGLALAILAVSALLLLHHAPPAAWAQGRTVPTVPQNVQVAPGDASLTLTWEAPSSWGSFPAAGYDVDWYAGASPPMDDSDWKRATLPASPLPSTATSYTFTGTYDGHTVANGTTYQLRVRAFSENPKGPGDLLHSFWVVASGAPRVLSAHADLSGLELANAAAGSDAPVDLAYPFASGIDGYFAFVLKEVTSITVKPTATAGDVATITVQLETGGTPETVASGAVSSAITITPKADPNDPHTIIVTVTAENGSDTRTYSVKIWQFDPVSFGGATVDDMSFTAGAEVPTENQISTIVLPKIAANLVTNYIDETYTATGLPAGLYLDANREIRGTPAAATNNPATVTYTAAAIGSSASLTFEVTVAPPVEFTASQLETLQTTVIEYTIGQAGRISETLPEATGGHGDLTYDLTYLVGEYRTVNGQTTGGDVEKSINDDAPGFSFDPATRVLTSDTGADAPSAAAYYSAEYWAEDENGARAKARINIDVNEAPTLPEIAGQNLTVGVDASATLPKASGGSLKSHPSLDYELSPVVEGLSFNGRTLVISGTPTLPGGTEMTYTVTDANGVSDSKTFTINVVNGPNAPSAAPASLEADRLKAVWAPVSGATAYVVQIKADADSYPDKPSNSAPDDVGLSFSGDATREWVVFTGLTNGDYKVRVAARNDDGVGPWSTEASFTVQAGGL